jgi:hypothetical protein
MYDTGKTMNTLDDHVGDVFRAGMYIIDVDFMLLTIINK